MNILNHLTILRIRASVAVLHCCYGKIRYHTDNHNGLIGTNYQGAESRYTFQHYQIMRFEKAISFF